MLVLKGIKKEYTAGDTTVTALKGVDIAFRENEFVSVLGPSGCGKTTLLNIVGGLDHYSDGDLIINGRSTKEYKDQDWDTYRNHSVGFVFQNYNLIPHQTVLSNVELAMTLTGVSKAERRQRAKDALEKVGLGDQLKKKPSQMSGGQMQRVAIARALVNDPDILLADEPTGALDTETSIQIMELLKDVAKDRLVVMVTHNPELAETYSTRIIRLLDGAVIGDTDPFDLDDASEPSAVKPKRLASMSFLTALSLSLNNLMTKKGRTILTAFAGSIGIIGIALILSLSNGIQTYIDRVQEDTLSTYPLSIMKEEYDMASIMTAVSEKEKNGAQHELDAVYSDSSMADIFDAMLSVETTKNDLGAFNEYLLSEESGVSEFISTIQYTYGVQPHIYSETALEDSVYRVNPSSVFSGVDGMDVMADAAGGGNSVMSMMMSTSNMDVWTELIDNDELLDSQYDVIAGHWPTAYNEVILVVDSNNELNDMYMYTLGLKNPDEVDDSFNAVMQGEEISSEQVSYTYDEILNLTYRLVLPTDYYRYNETDGTWKDMRDNDTYMEYIVKNGVEIKVVGIVRPKPDAVATAITGAVGYTNELTHYIINGIQDSDIVKQQMENPEIDVFTGLRFDDGTVPEPTADEKVTAFTEYVSNMDVSEKAELYIQIASVPDEDMVNGQVQQMMSGMDRTAMEGMLIEGIVQQAGIDIESAKAYLSDMTDEEVAGYVAQAIAEGIRAQYAQEVSTQLAVMNDEQLAAMLDGTLLSADNAFVVKLYDAYMPKSLSESTYDENMDILGYADFDEPTSINIYASSFEAKDEIVRIISEYNDMMREQGRDEAVISYTDYVGLLMSSITNIINVISYVLIGFVSISLIVSSIMIGIITYISVLERTKEIGILRSIGASKKDVSRVFNAETLIVGFVSGVLGILVTILLNWPISVIVKNLSDVPNVASLPGVAAIILVCISMFLTFIAGLIPSSVASKKDPVEALRTE